MIIFQVKKCKYSKNAYIYRRKKLLICQVTFFADTCKTYSTMLGQSSNKLTNKKVNEKKTE